MVLCFSAGAAIRVASQLQILATGHTEQIKLDKLQHPAVRTPPAVELQEESGDQGEINFNGDAAGGLGQPMPTTLNAFDPAEEQFDAPTLAIKSGDQFRGHLLGLLVGHQQEHLLGSLYPD